MKRIAILSLLILGELLLLAQFNPVLASALLHDYVQALFGVLLGSCLSQGS
ncbi:hypothetical protein [Leptolyngbya sp. FACHB-261]|uniref:hypothetical protein n=1 Tax=Leptolyngbya sp. FACHB-261 TaxID=2692806 RepID=UPI0016884B49|nr:hypothetical protein [Leptolyngbya sp. FACHB-261]